MALDACFISALVCEFNDSLTGARIDKIYQPEGDEIILSLHSPTVSEKLLLSANANIPRAHFTSLSKENPLSPPMFCMLLRKHIQNGKLKEVCQPDFERIIEFKIETLNDFGDTVIKSLIIEIMGRHSNIILLDENGKILSSIKHIDFSVSSVRQVLPGLVYEYPPRQDKLNPLACSLEDFTQKIKEKPEGITPDKFILSAFLGISPLTAREICHRASVDIASGDALEFSKALDLSEEMFSFFKELKSESFSPCIVENKENGKLMDFSFCKISQYDGFAKIVSFSSPSEAIDTFYRSRATLERIAVRSQNLLKVVTNNISRCAKKYEIQLKELKDAEKKERYRQLGELITSNMYKIKKGDTSLLAIDYNSPDMSEIAIELDERLTPSQNAQKYFKRYAKLKNAENFLSEEIKKTYSELMYLETVEEELKSAKTLSELSEIREELSNEGYIKSADINKNNKKRKASVYSPELTSFVTDDGFTILIGKNNKQNDYLTTKLARGGDLWFHTKDIPGSHVVLRHEYGKDFTDEAIIKAARVAAFYSKAKNSDNVPVDYTLIKNVKKPSGAKPGFVIFTDNKTLFVTPEDFE